MADEIKQKFGIDVSQALDALKQLDTAYQTHVKTLNSVADAMNQKGKQVQTAVKAVASETQRSMDSASSSVRRFHTSLELLSRIAFTQIAIKALRTLENSTAGAAREFIGFQKGLSEIKALDPESDLNELAKSSQQLSNSFNVKLMDVVAARLDLVGSGFTKASDQAKVFAASAGLAKLGAASQSEATDLLISSLNAYGKTADEAARFSRVFFAGADKGRFTIKELAANLGKAAPAARAVGISIEELTTLFSALTVAGVNPAEAATQANAIATAFIKPSKALKEAFKQLRVESGQQLIAQRGLAGAIQAVIKTTDGSAASIGKLFINQRALRPILTLNTDQFKTFNDHLANTQRLTQQEFDLRLQERLGTDAERATASLNKLSNALIVGLGGGIVQTIANFDRLIGKIDFASSATENFFRTITGHGLNDLGSSLGGIAKQKTNEILIGQNKLLQDQLAVIDRIKSTKPTGKLPFDAKNIQDLNALLDDALDLNRARAFQTGINSLLQSLDNQAANTDLGSPVRQATEQLKQLSSQAVISQQDVASLSKTFADIGGAAGGLGLGALDLLNRKQAQLKQIAPENLLRVQPVADSLGKSAQQLSQAGLTTEQALTRASEQLLNASKLLPAAATQAAATLAKAAASALQAGTAAGIQAQATGGVMRLAGGGFAPRGTDTIPAMLSPGEFVVNAKSTRRFFSQLQAINAGVAPIFRSEGGSVTNNNVSIGDVVVQGGDTSRQTARSIASELRRELRRGTSRL